MGKNSTSQQKEPGAGLSAEEIRELQEYGKLIREGVKRGLPLPPGECIILKKNWVLWKTGKLSPKLKAESEVVGIEEIGRLMGWTDKNLKKIQGEVEQEEAQWREDAKILLEAEKKKGKESGLKVYGAVLRERIRRGETLSRETLEVLRKSWAAWKTGAGKEKSMGLKELGIESIARLLGWSEEDFPKEVKEAHSKN
jgi:hypothetical protein